MLEGCRGLVPHTCWWDSEMKQLPWKVIWKFLALIIWYQKSHSWILIPEKWKITHTILYRKVYSNSIHNCQTGITQISISEWMVKQTGKSTLWNRIQEKQGMIHTTRRKNSRELCLMKQISPISLHTTWLYIFDILGIIKL